MSQPRVYPFCIPNVFFVSFFSTLPVYIPRVCEFTLNAAGMVLVSDVEVRSS